MKLHHALTAQSLIPTTLGTIAVLAIAFSLLFASQDASNTIANTFMKTSALEAIQTRTVVSAGMIQQRFQSVVANLQLARNRTLQSLTGDSDRGGYTDGNDGQRIQLQMSVNVDVGATALPTDIPLDPNGFPLYVGHYAPSVTNKSDLIQYFYVNTTTALVDIFSAVVQVNPSILKIYAGFDNGVFVRYTKPWTYVNGYLSNTFISAITGLPMVGYDPRHRPWYQYAQNALTESSSLGSWSSSSSSSVIFMPVTLDAATNKFLMTVAVAVPIEPSSFTAPAVVALDMDMTFIDEVVHQTRPVQSSYSMLVVQNGTIVSHPRMDISRTVVQTVFQLEPLTSADWALIVNKTRAGVSFLYSANGNGNGNVDGGDQNGDNIRYSCVLAPLPKLLFCVVFQDQHLEHLEIHADSQLKTTAITLSVIAVILVLVVMLLKSNKIANYWKLQITIERDRLNSIHKGNLGVDVETYKNLPVASSEFEQMRSTVSVLLTAMRFGSNAYQKNEPHKALKTFQAAADIMIQSNNPDGLAVAQNNQAIILCKLGNKVEAVRLYRLALDRAKVVLQQSSNGKVDNVPRSVKVAREKTFASRSANLGLVLYDLEFHQEAMEHMTNAKNSYQRIEYGPGIVQVSGNLAQMCLRSGNLEGAKEWILSSEKLLVTLSLLQRKSSANLNVHQDRQGQQGQGGQLEIDIDEKQKSNATAQFLAFNRALFAMAEKQYESAEFQFNSILANNSCLDVDVQHNCLVQLNHLMQLSPGSVFVAPYGGSYGPSGSHGSAGSSARGLVGSAQKAFRAAQKSALQQYLTTSARVIRLLQDVSQSMQILVPGTNETRIQKCRKSLKALISNHINENDLVALRTFSEESHVIWSLKQRGPHDGVNHRSMWFDIDTKTELEARTEFYAAMSLELEEAVKHGQSEQWMIVATDGEDTNDNSNLLHARVLEILKTRAGHVNLFILSIGPIPTADKLDELCRVGRGKHIRINLDSQDSIQKAFEQVATCIGQVTFEHF